MKIMNLRFRNIPTKKFLKTPLKSPTSKLSESIDGENMCWGRNGNIYLSRSNALHDWAPSRERKDDPIRTFVNASLCLLT